MRVGSTANRDPLTQLLDHLWSPARARAGLARPREGLHDTPGKRPDYDPSRSLEQDRGSTQGYRGRDADPKDDGGAARRSLFARANRADSGSEPGRSANKDYWLGDKADRNKERSIRPSELSWWSEFPW